VVNHGRRANRRWRGGRLRPILMDQFRDGWPGWCRWRWGLGGRRRTKCPAGGGAVIGGLLGANVAPRSSFCQRSWATLQSAGHGPRFPRRSILMTRVAAISSRKPRLGVGVGFVATGRARTPCSGGQNKRNSPERNLKRQSTMKFTNRTGIKGLGSPWVGVGHGRVSLRIGICQHRHRS